jgi:hypothetical protein
MVSLQTALALKTVALTDSSKVFIEIIESLVMQVPLSEKAFFYVLHGDINILFISKDGSVECRIRLADRRHVKALASLGKII